MNVGRASMTFIAEDPESFEYGIVDETFKAATQIGYRLRKIAPQFLNPERSHGQVNSHGQW
jgi:hypothetical protein